MTSRAPTADLKHNSTLGIGKCPAPALAGAGHETFEPQDIKMYTNRLFTPFVTIALVVLIAIRSLGFAVSPRTEVTGNFISTSTTIHSVNEEKFNEIIDLTSVITYTGTLEGTSTLEGTLTVHRDGTGTFKGVEIFTGLIYGKPGKLTFNVTGDNDMYQAIQLTSTITSGTGELASLHGALSMTGIIKDNGLVGTYTGQISKAPDQTAEK